MAVSWASHWCSFGFTKLKHWKLPLWLFFLFRCAFSLRVSPFRPCLFITLLGPHMRCLAVHSCPSWPLIRSQVYQRFPDSDIIPFPPQKTSAIRSCRTKCNVFRRLLLDVKQKTCWSHQTPENMLQCWRCI